MDELTGKDAQRLIDHALDDKDSVRLQAHLAAFVIQLNDARALVASWVDERGRQHTGQVATIPLENDKGDTASLFYSEIDGQIQSILTIIVTNDREIEGADIYHISGGQIQITQRRINSSEDTQATNSSMAQPTMQSCTQDCLLSCLQQYGCSGFAFTMCAAAILSCPFFLGSCIAAVACTLYCGGAFSICWSDICCQGL